MSKLHMIFNPAWIETYRLDTFVETGIGKGEGLEYALTLPFQKWYSVELYEFKIQKVRETGLCGTADVELVHGDSVAGLKSIVEKLEGNVCYWLDAHSPTKRKERSDALPLMEELEVLVNGRDLSRDVILMDDAEYYKLDSIKAVLPTHDVEISKRGGRPHVLAFPNEN